MKGGLLEEHAVALSRQGGGIHGKIDNRTMKLAGFSSVLNA